MKPCNVYQFKNSEFHLNHLFLLINESVDSIIELQLKSGTFWLHSLLSLFSFLCSGVHFHFFPFFVFFLMFSKTTVLPGITFSLVSWDRSLLSQRFVS